MKRFIHLLVCALVAAAMVLPAGAEPGGALWTREEAGGAYVTVRVPFPEGEGMSWGQTRYLGVRYAGTGEPVALTSDYRAGYLFATVPARDADRPLEVFQGERFDWTDIQYQNEPVSANTLYIRGVLHGDGEGRLNLEQVLTRAEAFSLLVRLLDLEEGGDPGYGDVAPSDWYYGPVSAARAAGAPVYTFSQKNPEADIYASQVRKRGEDILFQVRTRRYEREFRLTMPGLFNVENALAAIAVCEGLQIPQRHIYTGLAKARVPGRMEVFSNADNTVTALVDYAHNRMSFETLFRSVQAEYPGRRIVTVFGCPGLKALDRRRDLGEIAGKYSDLVVLTEEDSGEEDTLSICRQIAAHVAEQGGAYLIEPNRGEAIRQAVLSCDRPSILLITGKGRETRQKRGREYVEVPTDVEYVQTFLREYDTVRAPDGMDRVRSLLELLPALKRHAGKRLAVRCAAPGEALLQDLDALRTVGLDVVLLPPGGDAPGDADYLVYFTGLGEDRRLMPGRVDAKRAEELLGTLSGEPAAAVRRCLDALAAGAAETAVLDSTAEHALLLYLLDQPVQGMIISR